MALQFGRLLGLFMFCSVLIAGNGQLLSPNFYDRSCPDLLSIVQSEMRRAVAAERRMGASILRLFFHDCFVNGCDGSVLLDDIPGLFVGEKNAIPNARSLRGYEVIDGIKARSSLGGPSWTVQLGRRDATTASLNAANTNLPPPNGTLDDLISLFVSKGFSAREMTTLSGAHTLGFSRCVSFRPHIYSDADINPAFAAQRRQGCPVAAGIGDDNLAPLDPTSPAGFDNAYYQNLMLRRGLLRSDQELFNGGSQDSVVMTYSNNAAAFRVDFAAGMEKMGGMGPLTWPSGQIRLDCTRVN
ncbi:hypothetical protein ZIOFF_042569 [Zingiber officinale]|uniref:Peroxidase n=1 Tax=Zingiber officinale TaxID=94328 RepID=A0A8J5FTH1_ZINOF|nr:hypothetical protein ZIOFF_042569 [Zingiber officinale]